MLEIFNGFFFWFGKLKDPSLSHSLSIDGPFYPELASIKFDQDLLLDYSSTLMQLANNFKNFNGFIDLKLLIFCPSLLPKLKLWN